MNEEDQRDHYNNFKRFILYIIGGYLISLACLAICLNI